MVLGWSEIEVIDDDLGRLSMTETNCAKWRRAASSAPAYYRGTSVLITYQRRLET